MDPEIHRQAAEAATREKYDNPGKLHLRRVRIDNGGYDTAGTYWGLGQPLFEAYDDDGFSCYRRGPDRAAVKAQLRREHDTAVVTLKFYR